MGDDTDSAVIEFIEPDPEDMPSVTSWEFDVGETTDIEQLPDGTLEVSIDRDALEKHRGFELSIPADVTAIRVVRSEQ